MVPTSGRALRMSTVSQTRHPINQHSTAVASRARSKIIITRALHSLEPHSQDILVEFTNEVFALYALRLRSSAGRCLKKRSAETGLTQFLQVCDHVTENAFLTDFRDVRHDSCELPVTRRHFAELDILLASNLSVCTYHLVERQGLSPRLLSSFSVED